MECLLNTETITETLEENRDDNLERVTKMFGRLSLQDDEQTNTSYEDVVKDSQQASPSGSQDSEDSGWTPKARDICCVSGASEATENMEALPLELEKARVVIMLQHVIERELQKNCYGCQTGHPSQQRHSGEVGCIRPGLLVSPVLGPSVSHSPHAITCCGGCPRSGLLPILWCWAHQRLAAAQPRLTPRDSSRTWILVCEQDAERRRQWLVNIRRQDWMPNQSSRLCSQHFADDAFITDGGNRRLKSTAKPTVFSFPGHLEKNPARRTTKVSSDAEVSASALSLPLLTPAVREEGCCGQGSFAHPSVNISDEHSYHLNSPNTLKRKNDTMIGIVEKYQKRMKLEKQRTRRLKKNITTLKAITRELKSKLFISDQCATLLETINEVPKHIMRMILEGRKTASYSEELRQFATTLHFYSPKAYVYVRTRGSKQSRDTVCALTLDEMHLHAMTEYAGDQLHGYVDIGSGEIENNMAKEALVVMVVAINESWKVPIAYFLINSMDATDKANVVRESLSRLYEVGIKVVSLTFDGLKTNIAMARKLGANINIKDMKPYFPHPEDQSQQVHVLLDACHMLKLLRNAFASLQVLYTEDGQKIEYKYIEALNTIQEKEGLRLGNKLKMAHIQWRKQKMKVNLAAQLFSSSVADAIEFCDKGLKLKDFSGSAATVHFLRTVDAAFDVVNSRNPLGKGFKAPLKPSTKDRAEAILQRTEALLHGLRVCQYGKFVPLHQTKRETPILGFIATGRSVLNIYHDLVESNNASCRYLLTYKLSQDHLELFFAAVRARGGYNNNPNVRQFRAAYKRLLVRHQVRTGTGNCLLRDNTELLDATPATVSVARRADMECVEVDFSEAATAHLPDVNHLSEFKEAAVNYIAGFVVKRIGEKISCLACSQALTADDATTHPFITLKSRGGLQRPSRGIVHICSSTEQVIQRRIRMNGGQLPRGCGITKDIVAQVLAETEGKTLFPQLNDHMFETCVEANHVHVLVKMTSSLFCKVRFNHFAKRESEMSKKGKIVRRHLHKLIHFYGQ
ncbi:hypothetical protein ACEWY4_006028 [Coilia grayii]|uniref:THAP-type domain-containing protein n=1 Tax=Coilia grayii TaxID=363190 RepID=A0ABD1KCA1_9TELE